MDRSEIKVNIANLNAEISRMEALRAKLASEQLQFDFSESCGQMTDSLQDTATAFRELNNGIQELLQCTIDRLVLSRDTMIEADNTLADALH